MRRPSESITLKCCNLNVNEAIDKDADGIQIPRGNVSSLAWQVPKVLLKSFYKIFVVHFNYSVDSKDFPRLILNFVFCPCQI